MSTADLASGSKPAKRAAGATARSSTDGEEMNPAKKKSLPEPPAGYVCTRCGVSGHFRTNCDDATVSTAPGTGAAKAAPAATKELWLGDIPKKYAKTSILRNILYKILPKGIQQPALKKLVRKGYKNRPSRQRDDANGRSAGQQGGYLGFAILVFSSTDQAARFQSECDGIAAGEDEDFILRLKPANAPAAKRAGQRRPPGQDPPIAMQLNGLTKEALISRWMVTRQLVAAHETENGRKKPNGAKPATIEELPTEDELKYMKKSALVQRVQALHSRLPSRQECRTAGVPIPGQLRDALTSELRCLEWSATKHRKITAKHYLVLKRLDNSAVALGAAQSVGGKTISSDTSTMSSNQDDAMYSKLQQLAGELMQWVDPLSCWTHIAVTKNFIGAPHIDRFDISYQFVLLVASITLV